MDVRTALEAITADAARGDIVFPTHTEIALRVQRLLDDPDCSIDALGKLISAEPILSARVLGIATSIAYNPGGRLPQPSSCARCGKCRKTRNTVPSQASCGNIPPTLPH